MESEGLGQIPGDHQCSGAKWRKRSPWQTLKRNAREAIKIYVKMMPQNLKGRETLGEQLKIKDFKDFK